jgi:hypothetical protein
MGDQNPTTLAVLVRFLLIQKQLHVCWEELDILPLDRDQIGIPQEGDVRQADGGQMHDIGQSGLAGKNQREKR